MTSPTHVVAKTTARPKASRNPAQVDGQVDRGGKGLGKGEVGA